MISMSIPLEGLVDMTRLNAGFGRHSPGLGGVLEKVPTAPEILPTSPASRLTAFDMTIKFIIVEGEFGPEAKYQHVRPVGPTNTWREIYT